MKKLLIGFILCLPLIGMAARLPISEAGQKEADFYFDFLKGTLQAANNMQSLCESYGKLIEREPENKYLRRHMLLCALEKKDFQTADKYADYINQGENDAEDLGVYAVYSWQKGNIAQAQDYYEQALKKNPDNTLILNQYILLLSAIDVDRAAEKIQERKEQYPDQAAMLNFETGNLYRMRKDYQTALSYYQAATEVNKEYIPAYLARAEIYSDQKQYFLMMHELEALEKLGYQSPNVFTTMGAFYVLVKDNAKAKEYFLKAKSLDKGNDAAGKFLAKDAQGAGEWLQAAQYLRETDKFATEASRWLEVSFLQQRAGDTAAALQTLKEAYEKFDHSVEIGYFYALLLQDEKQYRQTEKVLKQVLKTSPEYENARLAYAFTLESLKKYKQMEQQVKLIIAQNPKKAAAYNLLAYSLAERNLRLSEAQELSTKALSLAPHDLSFQDTLAWIYYHQGKYEQALNILQQIAPSFVKSNPELSYHIGAVYAAMGKTEQARIYLEQAADYPQAVKLRKQLFPAP